MGYRPRPGPPRCSHDPVEVRTLITDELVGHVCTRCLESVDVPPPPPPGRGGASSRPPLFCRHERVRMSLCLDCGSALT